MPASAGAPAPSPAAPSRTGAGSVRRQATPAEVKELRRREVAAAYIRDGMSEALARKLAAAEVG